MQTLFPDVARLFRSFAETIGTAAENDNIRQIYRNLSTLNFSKDILERIAIHAPRSVTGLPVLQVTWSDWGTCDRLSKTIRQLGTQTLRRRNSWFRTEQVSVLLQKRTQRRSARFISA
jgi:hypothetical protein